MLRYLNLVVWDSEYHIAVGKPSVIDILELPELIEAIANKTEEGILELRVYTLAVDAEEELLDDDMLEIVADNLPAMLADGTVVVSDYGEFTLNGVANRNLGLTQHIADCKRYYAQHPFM